MERQLPPGRAVNELASRHERSQYADLGATPFVYHYRFTVSGVVLVVVFCGRKRKIARPSVRNERLHAPRSIQVSPKRREAQLGSRASRKRTVDGASPKRGQARSTS
jgi:hypothetical protein